MTVQEKLAQIKAERIQAKQDRELAMLDKPTYVDYVLAKDDSVILDRIISDISEAYQAPVYAGFTYAENVEKLVAICNKLQFAKAEQRELISEDYYQIFDRAIRDMVIEAYGQLPYSREVTTIELADGTIEQLDADLVSRAKAGIKPNVPQLQTAIDILANTLNLTATYTVTQSEADKAWDIAKGKITKVERLQAIASDYKKSLA